MKSIFVSCVLVTLLLLASRTHGFNYSFPDCTNGPLSAFPICDPSLYPAQRAADLVSRLTVAEKIANLDNTAPGSPKLGLPNYQWWSEALHGIADSPGVTFAPRDKPFGYATSFPSPIGLGAAFDDKIVNQMGQVISTEGRAFNNFARAGLDFWTPNINPFKDPRWGRGLETPGEDPFHVSSYVYHLITGLQNGEDSRYYKVVADCKHFVAYDLENWNGMDRHHFDAIVSDQDAVEYYYPSFESCIRNAQVGSIMCSYNSVNGIPSCANSFILQTVARDLWGFDGWVTSDCDAVNDIYSTHHYTTSEEQAAADALLAGTDLDCGGTYGKYLQSALNKNLIQESDIDRALTRSFISLIKLGYFDSPADQPYRQLNWSDVNTPQAQQWALNAAVESMVLLKNDGVLPLSPAIKLVAVIGPMGNATAQFKGNYDGDSPYVISPLMALTALHISYVFVFGCEVNSTDTSGFDEALKAAQGATSIIYIGGIDTSVEHEGHDRTSIEWPGVQLQLIQALEKLGKPLVVVQVGGGQIDDSYLKESSMTNGLLWAGYPGQSGGTAIMNVIFGINSPAGRLPITQYPANYVNQVAMTDTTLRPSDSNPGRTYKWYTGEPIYPFGYGLSYTSFSYVWSEYAANSFNIQEITKSSNEMSAFTSYVVNVTNTGKIASDVVVLLFVNGTDKPPVAPFRELIAYQRPYLIQPKEVRTVYFTLTLRSISRVDSNGDRWVMPGKYRVFAQNEAEIDHTFELTGSPALLAAWPRNPLKPQMY